MALSDYVNTFGRHLLKRHGERVHKLAINAGFTCPNRDGSKGRGGCTFCNNSSFSPNVSSGTKRGRDKRPEGTVPVNAGKEPDVLEQIESGRRVLAKRTGAKKFLAYFQAYTNTYDDPLKLKARYDSALAEPDVLGLAIGTRPDCVPPKVLDLLAAYRDQGYEVWLELGLQSAFDHTLQRVNRGHGFAEYRDAVAAARERGLPVCTHLIVGLPGEEPIHNLFSLERVLDLGVEGLKLHPLHVVKGTMLANQWRRHEYTPWMMQEYVKVVADMVERTPPEVIYHRLTGTAEERLLLAPGWCSWKWRVLNAIERELARRGTCQGYGIDKNTSTQRRKDAEVAEV
ncbi:MAG: TIGR01212 family radical SAM protein [Pseudomonadota bacterium]